ncbi:CD225/dispanin family protein [Pseudoxanthomonas wuyuanensis]|uniref:Interferon-induced transmembrane protein n=1 Tax=Pseudoxanthomonas wuyuanensis TaxID=1073196 RepID=A0A286D250_9GAMM|nr:CD225/dispanin family protein [Pseudoxanthomonas wuyuanensis]SOD52728.1 Interferon-induced transmembrane protein [Pseudoxanthomonas wuyuanensis]
MSSVPPLPPQATAPYIPNHLVWAILTTLFCCLPMGIVSIVYAAQVDGKRAAGDIAGALETSRKAKFWAVLSACVAIVPLTLYLIFAFVVGGLSVLAG